MFCSQLPVRKREIQSIKSSTPSATEHDGKTCEPKTCNDVASQFASERSNSRPEQSLISLDPGTKRCQHDEDSVSQSTHPTARSGKEGNCIISSVEKDPSRCTFSPTGRTASAKIGRSFSNTTATGESPLNNCSINMICDRSDSSLRRQMLDSKVRKRILLNPSSSSDAVIALPTSHLAPQLLNVS